MAGKCEIDNT